MVEKIRWGIIAPGGIAEKFATGIAAAANGELYGVCSRSLERAQSFMQKFGGEQAYASEAEIAADPNIDIIYVANPHPYHLESALTCLNAGKAVLCEKPMTVNAESTRKLVRAARENEVFLMEAMWSRFLPTLTALRDILQRGILGEVRMVSANFGFRVEELEPSHRLLALELAGGALLDVGIYPLAFCSMVLGRPERIQSSAYLGSTGVDEQFSAVFEYGNGVLANVSGAVQTQTNQEAWIYGTKGAVKLESPWWCGSRLRLFRVDPAANNLAPRNVGEEEIIDLPFESNGYNCEAEAVAESLLKGETESAVMPLDESIELAETMDIMRQAWGLVYPCER